MLWLVNYEWLALVTHWLLQHIQFECANFMVANKIYYFHSNIYRITLISSMCLLTLLCEVCGIDGVCVCVCSCCSCCTVAMQVHMEVIVSIHC